MRVPRLTSRKARTSRSVSRPAGQRPLGRVLLVEDDPVLALSLEQALVDGGARSVTICQTVRNTMRELERCERYDTVILDVHLADRDDGWAIAEVLTLLGPRPPKIAFSTGAPEEIPPQIASLGPVFEKPYDPRQLVRVLSMGRRRGIFSRYRR